MPLNWIQEQRWHAKGPSGNFYHVFPFANMNKFGASVTRLDDTGNPVTDPIGDPFDTAQAAQAACAERYEKALRDAQASQR